ncbi:TetR/AcrR family transcriptional regulator [Frankia sp. CNm7]|uniref:TetR/AcrR family transcriptional regulator n=1 Tax=Frankia nepalensis TaxID=1836974 RepID=A0A937RNR4_9ACTN|nr:TetR/AcrR family transcriptional regulator [Frankia nepalensis]MBL7501974.1 TetR/AcrR family transcriptional regulator [Frankia nepalensis]MBL7510604.1 TetR/AcrR family transcriptional regulator [Frankia nepalensis]MBL7517344.1 TetR/AcrR family transcriptional regulator [Frankia nepalensis]MBL7633427.1 TetR/AcrR family transcriptional regulator [Frankia nepalensis]
MPIERVIAAAVKLVDEVGPGDFSMRLLAQRLQSSTATLYRHFASKDEIFAEVVDHVLGEVPRHLTDTADTATWQERLITIADALFRTLKKHPTVVSLFNDHIPFGPQGLAARETAMGVLLSSGFSPEAAAKAYTVVAHYTIGFASQLGAYAGDGPEDDQGIREFYDSLDPARYPATVASAPFLPSSLDDEFRFGLQLIVDGLTTQLAAVPTPTTPSPHRR